MLRLPTTLLALLLVAFAVPRDAAAQSTTDAEIVVMNLAAHPDDEDGRTLAYYRWAKNARSYSVIYTRGEGGQNEIGPELYEDLGAIRTEETERAARILGTQVYFLNFEDFGFSKSAAETFERWGGRDEVTARLTYLIRKLKPDVLFTNHDTVTVGPGRQHGHHQAVGISAYDAFALAADPSYHPEQLDEEGVDLWQPKRLFLRHWNRPETVAVTVPVGDTFIDGRSYADVAADALREHASQGMAMFAGRFSTPATYFTLLRRDDDTPLDPDDLAGGLEPATGRPAPLRYLIDAGRIPSLPRGAISASDSVAVPGSPIRITWNPELLPPLPLRIRLSGAIDTTLIVTRDTPPATTVRVAADATPNRPLRRYQYARFISSPPVTYEVVPMVDGQRTHAGYVDMDVAPPLILSSPSNVVRLQDGRVRIPVEVSVWDASLSSAEVRAVLTDPSTRTAIGETYEKLALNGRGTYPITLQVRTPNAPDEGTFGVVLTAAVEGMKQVLTHSLSARSFTADVPHGLRVGVVESYDDALSHALSELGVDHVMLDSTALAEAELSNFHTILIDIRAYLVRPDLQSYNRRLLDWVARGGHLVVNYHKTFEWDADRWPPYPIHLSRARVTREDAPVTLLVPTHSLFHEPNRVRPADWDGWVQERGLYFPSEYDERYLELFALNDPGEPEQRGSTLLARHGEGTYLYSALVWYRQLKEFHPGAFRMFANMISLPLADGRASVELGTSP